MAFASVTEMVNHDQVPELMQLDAKVARKQIIVQLSFFLRFERLQLNFCVSLIQSFSVVRLSLL